MNADCSPIRNTNMDFKKCIQLGAFMKNDCQRLLPTRIELWVGLVKLEI